MKNETSALVGVTAIILVIIVALLVLKKTKGAAALSPTAAANIAKTTPGNTIAKSPLQIPGVNMQPVQQQQQYPGSNQANLTIPIISGIGGFLGALGNNLFSGNSDTTQEEDTYSSDEAQANLTDFGNQVSTGAGYDLSNSADSPEDDYSGYTN